MMRYTKQDQLNAFLSRNTQLGVDDVSNLGLRVEVYADGVHIDCVTHIDFQSKTITKFCIDASGKVVSANNEPKQEKINYKEIELVAH